MTSNEQKKRNPGYNEEHIYAMPPVFDSSLQSTKSVGPLKNFMRSILSLLQDEKALGELHSFIDKCDQEPVKTTNETMKYVTEKENPMT